MLCVHMFECVWRDEVSGLVYMLSMGDMVGSNYSIICYEASFLTTVERVQWSDPATVFLFILFNS